MRKIKHDPVSADEVEIRHSGKPEKVEFIIPKKSVSVVIDFFGSHVSFFDRGE